MNKRLLTGGIVLLAAVSAARAQSGDTHSNRLPIIDMHLHAYPATFAGEPGAPSPLSGGEPAPATEAEIMEATLAAMQRHNIVLGVVGGALDIVARWRVAMPDRILAAASFPVFVPWPDIAQLRAAHGRGELHAIGEITAQYAGLPADAPELEPYYTLAEQLDIPVIIHLAGGPPESVQISDVRREVLQKCCPDFRLDAGNPARLEPVLKRHRKLRVSICHTGGRWLQETLAIMSVYPRVYTDISGGWRNRLRKKTVLLTFIRAGFGKRLMFGSDQMIWPDIIDKAVDNVESADYLSPDQKRDIFCFNAARFLHLDESICQQ